MSTTHENERRRLIRDLVFSRLGLLLFLLLAVGICLLFIASAINPGFWERVCFAGGVATISSVVLTTAQQLVTTGAVERALADTVAQQCAALIRAANDETRALISTMHEETRALSRDYLPTHSFDATMNPDPAFNRTLMEDLARTRQFMFRGFSARHTAARLIVSTSRDWEVRIVIADPTKPDALNARARHVQLRDLRQRSAKDVQAELVSDIELGLVGLYAARTKCSKIEVTAIANPTVDRFEFFDDSVWITLFSNTQGRPATYPRTLRYGSGSFIYSMERTEFLHVHGAAGTKRAIIQPNTTDQEFLSILADLTERAVTSKELQEQLERFDEFTKTFAGLAELEEK